jgi:hypothetical protein
MRRNGLEVRKRWGVVRAGRREVRRHERKGLEVAALVTMELGSVRIGWRGWIVV